MKSKKRFVSLLLTLIMVLTAIPMNGIASMAVSASDFTEPTIFVDSKYSAAGSTVTVDIAIANNPGIAGATLTVAYDPFLTLTSAANGEAFSSLTFTKPGSFSNPARFLWDSESGETKKDGTILTLTFDVSESAPAEANLNIEISSNLGDFYDEDMETVNLQFVNGTITVIDYLPGDVNGDDVVNGKDVTMVRRHIVGGYDQIINEAAADVNEDGTINGKDVTAIRRFIVGGYDIVLKPSKPACNHQMEAMEYKVATCTEEGNIAYWYCMLCDKYFKDANGSTEVSFENTIIPAKGHTIVIDPAVAPTYESEGCTEGSHCSECGEIIAHQNPIPMLQKTEHSIKYDIANGDLYLASLLDEIENPNPSIYYSEDGLTLKNLNVPGYQFLGWYDMSAGENAENIKKIPVGQNDDVELYAHWETIKYTAQFNSNLIPIEEVKFTVDKAKVLPTPQLDGYIFTGWSDDNGVIIKSIPAGTKENKVYTANWLSERNKAWTKTQVGDPIIIEDEETNSILFTYEIGRIENVPLDVIEDFGYINANGVTKNVSKTYSFKTSKQLMNQYAKNITSATTDSLQWSLSSGWSDSVSVDQSFLDEHDMTLEEAKTRCTTDSDNWLISKGSAGSTTTTTYQSSQDYDLQTSTGNTKTYDTHEGSASGTIKESADLKLSAKENIEINGMLGGLGAKAGVEFSQELDQSIEGTTTKANSSKTGSEDDSGYSNQTGSVKHTGTDTEKTSSWNTSSSYGGSKSVSESDSVSQSVSQKIASQYGYGQSYIKNGDETTTQDKSVSSSNSDTYSSAVTYGTEQSVEETVSYTTSNTKTGYHRYITAGTAHVFAIVGYDIKNAAYFATTYTVMDDETHYFEDYSYSTALYDDNQNGVIPFEVPYESIEKYVLSKIGETEGLEFNSAGVVTGYTGTEKAVVIPEYHVIDNRDGTRRVVKVTGISSTAFSGNTNITGIEFSENITAVPANAFEGCTSLSLVNMAGATSIGANAFKDCTQIDFILLSNKIETLGDNAFDNISSIAVFNDNFNVINGAVNSGTENVYIYISDSDNSFNEKTLTVNPDIEVFTFNGRGNSFNNFSIVSDAKCTVINNAFFNSTMTTPLTISSPDVQLGQVTASSIGFALKLTNSDCELGLYGESSISSTSKKAILFNYVNVSKTDDATENGVYCELTVSGDVFYKAYLGGSSLINCSNGSIVQITDLKEYIRYLRDNILVTFDANGGSVSSSSISAKLGETYGTLPTPTRQYYVFDGWYTDKNFGEKVTSSTTVEKFNDVTLYAHWKEDTYTISFNANGGTVSESSRTAFCNKAVGTLPVPTKEHYNFGGWFTAASGGEQVTSTTVFSNPTNITLYAHWNASSYYVSVSSANVNMGTVSGGGSVTYGQSTTITAIPATGYSFVSWNDGNTNISRTITPSGDVSYIASFVINTYTVTMNANGGSVGTTTYSVNYGSNLALPTPTRAHYNFDGWFTAASGGEQYTSNTAICANVTLYAHWTEMTKVKKTGSYATGNSSAPINISWATTGYVWNGSGNAVKKSGTGTSGWDSNMSKYVTAQGTYAASSGLTSGGTVYQISNLSTIDSAIKSKGSNAKITSMVVKVKRVDSAHGNATGKCHMYAVSNTSSGYAYGQKPSGTKVVDGGNWARGATYSKTITDSTVLNNFLSGSYKSIMLYAGSALADYIDIESVSITINYEYYVYPDE